MKCWAERFFLEKSSGAGSDMRSPTEHLLSSLRIALILRTSINIFEPAAPLSVSRVSPPAWRQPRRDSSRASPPGRVTQSTDWMILLSCSSGSAYDFGLFRPDFWPNYLLVMRLGIDKSGSRAGDGEPVLPAPSSS